LKLAEGDSRSTVRMQLAEGDSRSTVRMQLAKRATYLRWAMLEDKP